MKELKIVENLTSDFRNTSLLSLVMLIVALMAKDSSPAIGILLIAASIFIFVKALKKWRPVEELTNNMKKSFLVALGLFVAVIIVVVALNLLLLISETFFLPMLILAGFPLLSFITTIFIIVMATYKRLKRGKLMKKDNNTTN
jgi:hypothetical protein